MVTILPLKAVPYNYKNATNLFWKNIISFIKIKLICDLGFCVQPSYTWGVSYLEMGSIETIKLLQKLINPVR
jgi:hypothetical protein